jgi:hypothetical protein
MIVREHINFKRGIDPRVAMGTGNRNWEKLDVGSVLKLLNSLYNLHYHEGTFFVIKSFIHDYRPNGTIRFRYAAYKNEHDLENDFSLIQSNWEMGKQFFEENFEVIEL